MNKEQILDVLVPAFITGLLAAGATYLENQQIDYQIAFSMAIGVFIITVLQELLPRKKLTTSAGPVKKRRRLVVGQR